MLCRYDTSWYDESQVRRLSYIHRPLVVYTIMTYHWSFPLIIKLVSFVRLVVVTFTAYVVSHSVSRPSYIRTCIIASYVFKRSSYII